MRSGQRSARPAGRPPLGGKPGQRNSLDARNEGDRTVDHWIMAGTGDPEYRNLALRNRLLGLKKGLVGDMRVFAVPGGGMAAQRRQAIFQFPELRWAPTRCRASRSSRPQLDVTTAERCS